MHFLSDYGLYLLKTITAVIAILILVGGIIALSCKEKHKEKLQVKKLNKKYADLKKKLQHMIFNKQERKQHGKADKEKQKKFKQQEKKGEVRKRIYVINFHGDIRASQSSSLREEVTAVLSIAKPSDEVLVNIESAGGMVNAYGLAASQLKRIRSAQIPLTVAVDKVAASGGYLMACVANTILAAPFAIIGSIGVVAQLPNFHRLLKKKNIDFEQITAGEYKRTLTVFGDNTNEGRHKFKEQLEEIHTIFKDFIAEHRPTVDICKIATGEHWLANRAYELNLVDKLITSDDYLLQASDHCDIYEIQFRYKKTLSEKFSSAAQSFMSSLFFTA